MYLWTLYFTISEAKSTHKTFLLCFFNKFMSSGNLFVELNCLKTVSPNKAKIAFQAIPQLMHPVRLQHWPTIRQILFHQAVFLNQMIDSALFTVSMCRLKHCSWLSTRKTHVHYKAILLMKALAGDHYIQDPLT